PVVLGPPPRPWSPRPCTGATLLVWILSVLLFQRLGQRVFGCQVSVDLLAIRVVVREGGIDLREGEVRDARRDLFGVEAKLVPTRNAPNGDAGASDPRSSAANFGRAHDHCTDIDRRAHGD